MMPTRKKKEEKPQAGPDLTAFLGQPLQKEGTAKPPVEAGEALLISEIEEKIVQLLRREREGLTRSQLYAWSKKTGIKPASFYKALSALIEKGVVIRRFDPAREEYVFLLSKQ